MNFTKEDIRAALSGGGTKWSDLAGPELSSSRPYLQQQLFNSIDNRNQSSTPVTTPTSHDNAYTESINGTDGSNLSPDTSKITDNTATQVKSGTSIPDNTNNTTTPLKTSVAASPMYNPRSLVGKSFRDYASMLYDNQLFSIDQNKGANLKPQLDLANTLKDNSNNPELYKLLDLYANKKTQSLLYDPANDDVNNASGGFRKLDNYEIPSDLIDANNKFGDQIVNWSKIDESSDINSPKLSEVLSGKNINSTSAGNNWYPKQIDSLENENNVADQDKMTIQQSKDALLSNNNDQYDPASTVTENTPIAQAAAIGVDTLAKNQLQSSGVKPTNDYLLKNQTAVTNAVVNASTPVQNPNDTTPVQPVNPYNVVENAKISTPFDSNKIYGSPDDDSTLFGSIKKASGLISGYIGQSATDQLSAGYGVMKPEGIKLASMYLAPEAKLGAEGKTGKIEKQDYPISDWVSQNISEGLGQALRGLAIGTETEPGKFGEIIEDLARQQSAISANAAEYGSVASPFSQTQLPLFQDEKSNKTLSDLYKESSVQSKASRLEYAKGVDKAEEQLPDTWQAKAGGMVPLAAVTIGGILSGQPEVSGAAITTSFMGTGYADALNLADKYEKETGKPIDDNTKSLLGFGTSLIFGIPLGSLAKELGGIIKNTPLKVVQESVLNFISKNPELIASTGDKVFKTLADQMPSAVKSFATSAGKGALHSVATMEGIGVAQNILNKAIIGKDTDWVETFKSGLESGLMFSLATVPFAHASYATRSAIFKNATDSNGDISLSVTDDGKSVYVDPKNGDGKTFGTTVDGKRVELNDDEVKRTFTMTAQHLKDELASYKKTKTVNPDIEQNATENRVRNALSKLTTEDGTIPIVRSDEKGMQIVTGESANGSPLGVNINGESDYIPKEAVPEKAKFNDVYNELMSNYDKNRKSTAETPSNPTTQEPTINNNNPEIPESFSNTISNEPLAPVAVSGISNDSRYEPSTLHENAMIHIEGGMSTNINTQQGIDNANKIINAGVVRDMQMNDRVIKTNSYINSANSGRENDPIKYLTQLAKNPPVGIDPTDVNNELKIAKHTLAVYRDRNVTGYANRAGGIASENHKLLTSLIVDHDQSASQFDEVSNGLLGSYYKQRADLVTPNTLAQYSDYTKPDVKSIGNPNTLFDSLAHFEALKNISIENNSKNEHAVRKNSILNYELDKKKEVAAQTAHDELVSNGIIDPMNQKDISFDKMSKKIDSLNLPTIDKNLTQTLALHHISDLSSKYEGTMSKLLANRKVEKFNSPVKKNIDHDIFVDKMLDAYRTSRKIEENNEKVKQTVDDIKGEDASEEQNPPLSSYESNSNLITPNGIKTGLDAASDSEGMSTDNIPMETEDEYPAEQPIDDTFQDLTEDNDLSGIQDEDIQKQEETDEVRGSMGETIGSIDEAIFNLTADVDDLIKQLESTSIGDEKDAITKEVTKEENEKVIDSIKDSNELITIISDPDSSTLNQAIEEIPGLDSTNSILHDRISRTLFADTNNPAIKDFLMDPEAFKTAEFRIIVNKHHNGTTTTYTVPTGGNTISGEDYTALNDFDHKNPDTYDNAYIKVEVKYQKDGQTKTIAFSMKNPGEREIITDNVRDANNVFSKVLKYTPEEIAALRDFRNNIITEWAKTIADPSLKLRLLHGLERGISKLALNRDKEGNAIQRGLHKVKGLLEEPDVNKLGVGNLVVSYGRGEKGGNMVVSLFETMGISNSNNSGAIFITIPDPLSSDEERKIKINKKRIGLDDGIAELIYTLAIDLKASSSRQITLNPKGQVIQTTDTSPYGLTASILLHKITNFGEGTQCTKEDQDFLKQKQFFVLDGVLHFGENELQVNNISPQNKLAILDYIKKNFTWAVDKDDLWNRENNTDNLVSDLFPGVRDYLNREPDQKGVAFAPGMSINREDLGTTWTAWLIKHEKLTSDTADGVFEPPFLFMTDVRAVSNDADEIVPIKNGAYNTSPAVKTEMTQQADPTEIVPPEASIQVVEVPKREVKSLDEFDDFGAPRLIDLDNTIGNPIDTEDAKAFLEAKLGKGFETSIVDDVIKLAAVDFAQGLTRNGKIDIFAHAEEGTEFHEAYHAAELLLIPRKRRMAIYDSIRKSMPEFEDKGDKEIGEYLAEKFRERLLAKDVSFTMNSAPINLMFRKIYNAFNALSKFKNRDIERLFEDIESGLFKDSKLNKLSQYEFEQKYGSEGGEGAAKRFKDNGLHTIKTYEAKDKLVNSLTYYLFEVSGIQTIDDINKLDYDGLKASIGKSVEKAAANQMEIRYSIYKEIYDRFDNYFLQEIKNAVKNTGITEFKDKSDNEGDGIVSKEAASHDKASYEISKRDNIREEVKFFIRTIPETILKDNSVVVKRDVLSNFPTFVDFGLSWNTMIYELHSCPTVESMKQKIATMAHDKNNPFFIMLERRLSKMDDNFLTKFWNTMYSHRHDYVNTVYNANSAKEDSEYQRSIRNISSNIDRATRVLPMQWGQNLLSNGVMYSMTDNGLVFNEDKSKAIIDEYTKLSESIKKKATVEDSNKYLDKFIELLGKASIDVDVDTMDYLINNGYAGLTRQQAISSIIKDYKTTAKVFTTIIPTIISDSGKKSKIKVNELTPKNMFIGEKSVSIYAEAYAKTHPNPNEVIVAGADGADLYQISSRNYLDDVVDRISNDKDFLNNMLSVPINQGSILLNQIKDGTSKGVSFGTFVKLYEEGVADQGRDYFDLSPIEDYIFKMSNLLDSNIALPTMADKKTYGFIYGVKLPDMVSGKKNSQKLSWNSNKLSYPSEVINIFSGYYDSEFNAIKQAWAKYKQENGNEANLIDGYHYSDKGVWAAGHGNGLRFRYFDSLFVNSNTLGDEHSGVVDLNAYIDKVLNTEGPIIGNNAAMDKALDILGKKFFNETYENKSKMISSSITAHVKHELDYAEKLGLISRHESDYIATIERPGVHIGDTVKSIKYTNEYLDAALFKDNVAAYVASGISTGDAPMVAITNIIANSAINHIISEFETDKLLSKDMAFYKNDIDKTKRLSTTLSTGTALRLDFPEGHLLHNKTSYNVAQINDSIIKSTELGYIKNISYAAQVNRLLEQSKEHRIEDLREIYTDPSRVSELDELKNKYPKQFKVAEDIIDRQSKAYDKVNVTDATSYISDYMYRSIQTRLGDDHFTKEMDEAFELLDAEDLAWVNDPDKYEKVMNLSLHPLKMAYFGDTFKDGMNVPKLNKMALFVLPRFLATGDLATLYNRMNHPDNGKQSIEMAIFSTAVKTGSDKPVSVYNDKEESSISALNDLKVSPQSFRYLRLQLPTDPHEGSKMTIATQVQKASMGNIIPDQTYQNITIDGKRGASGAQIIKEWNSALNELSDRGKSEVEKEFGLKSDPITGDYNFDTKKMYSFLAREAENGGMPSDVVEMLKSFDSKNEENVPLQALVDNAFVESKILSKITKGTIDVKAPGGMFIQMTPFGLTAAASKAGSYSTYIVNGGKKLNFQNPDGSMDIAVSLTMFKDIIPEELKSHAEKVEWLKKNNIIGENSAPSGLGYRIPTQGLSSISSVRFADVLPEMLGDTAVFPPEFTAVNGSDFDVDKVFITRYNYTKMTAEDGTIYYKKSEMDDSLPDKFKQNSVESIQNRFIDSMMAVVSDPNNVNETKIPLDAVTGPVKDALKIIDKYAEKDTDVVPFKKASLSYESLKKIENAGGKQGIPTYALAGVNHVLTQIAKLRLKNSGVIEKFKLSNLGAIYDKDNVSRILDWMSAMVNAHVDVANDPYIIRMGINANTYKMSSLLLREGYGENVFFFLSQPALREAYKIMDSKGSEYLAGMRDIERTSIENVVSKLIDKYKTEAQKLSKTIIDKSQLEHLYEEKDNGFVVLHNENVFDKTNLINGLARKSSGFDYYFNQLRILETFNELSPLASELAELVKYSQIDTNKGGNSFSAQRLFFEKVNQIIGDEHSSFENVGEYFNNTFLYKKLVNSAGLSKKLSQGVLFRTTTSVEKSADRVLTAMGRYNQDNREIISKVNKFIDTKIKSTFFDALAKKEEVDVAKLFFGDNTMAKRLYSIQQRFPELTKDNYFLRGMTPIIYSKLDTARADHIRPKDNNTNEPDLTEKLKQHFSSLLDSDNKEIQKFAKDFILYQFYSTGDNHATNTVKISEYDRKDTGYYDFVRNKLSELANINTEALSDSDLIDIFENRWYDKDIVPTKQHFKWVTNDEGKAERSFMPSIISTKQISGLNYPLSFVDTRARQLIPGQKDSFPPFIKIQLFPQDEQPFYILYRLYGTSAVDLKGKFSPMYLAVDKKGTRKDALSVIEHNVDKSMVKDNILPQSFSGVNRISDRDYKFTYAHADGEYTRMLKSIKSTPSPFSFFMPGSDIEPSELNDVNDTSNIKESINKAVDTAISNNEFNVFNLMDQLNDDNITNPDSIKAARYAYGEAILNRSNEFSPTSDMIESDGLFMANLASKMNVESHGKSLMRENESHANYFNPTDNTETKALEAKTQEQVGVNSITPDDKIIYGHPGLGKTYAKEKGANIIVPDDDYNVEHKQAHALKRLVRQSQEDSDRYEQFLTDWWNRIKSDALDQGKQIINSNLPFLIRFPEDFDKVINMSDELFIERSKQRNDYKPGETESWKKAINDAISKIDPSKIVNTDKYLSDLLPEVNNPNKLPNNENNREYTPDNIFGKRTILTGYQGVKDMPDNRRYNYFTLNEREAGDYGNLVEKETVDTTDFLHKRNETNRGVTPEFIELEKEFIKKTGVKYFDILDSSPKGLKDQELFFEFLESKGYPGYSDIIKGYSDSEGGKNYPYDNAYFVTFNKESNYIASDIAMTEGQFNEMNKGLEMAGMNKLTIDEIRGLSDEEIQKLIDCN